MKARMRFGLGLAVGILLVSAAAPAVASKAEERFNAAYDATEECSDTPDSRSCARAVAAAGREIDRFVLAQLRAGRSAEAINKVLSKLNGYLPASTGKGMQTSCATFWSEPPRAAPTYVVAPLPGGPVERLLGVFNFSSVLSSGPGRLSLFTRKEGGWQRS